MNCTMFIVIVFLLLGHFFVTVGATFGASCISDANCFTPEEFCSGVNCACSTGYVHDGNGVCIAVDCGTPTNPTNGAISTTGTSFQNTGTVTCNTGYSLVGSSTITCSSSGTWTTIPTCSSGSIKICSSSRLLVSLVIILNVLKRVY